MRFQNFVAKIIRFLKNMCGCTSYTYTPYEANFLKITDNEECLYTLEDLEELLLFYENKDPLKYSIIKSQINLYGKRCNKFRKYITQYITEYNSSR